MRALETARRAFVALIVMTSSSFAATSGLPPLVGLPNVEGLANTVELFTAAGLPAATSLPATTQEPAARIVVEPEYLATRDGDNAHVELHVAANPRRAANLVAGAITHTRPDGTPATKAYATFDGGRTWIDRSFPDQVEHGGGDPQVAFTPAGTALLATLNTKPDDTGRTRAFLHVYRSEDGGRTWEGPADLGVSYDHEMIAVDHTTGRFAGRIYLSALYGREYKLGVFRSDDEGRSFIGPVEFFEAGGTDTGANVLPMAIFRDGGLLATFRDFPLGAERQSPEPGRNHFFTVVSDDGGVTFSEPRPAPDEVAPPRASREARLAGDAAIGIDASDRFPDRAYRVWNDARSGPFRIVISTSDDRGRSWSEPRPIDPDVPAATQQFLPAMAINRDGVVGVSWNDTRDQPGGDTFRRYFSASVDGGASFLPAVAISTRPSHPFGAGNLRFTPSTFVTPIDGGAVRMSLLSAAGRWGNGGDYAAMAADADGIFHPFWADSRSGTYQGWTARVRIIEGGETAAGPGATSGIERGADEMPANAPANAEDVTSSIEFLSDPSSFDPATNELELRLRLKNVSSGTLLGPLALTIRRFGSGQGDDYRESMPEVLNADNGARGDGARFIVDAALGSERALAAGGVSGPIVIRMRLPDPLRVPDLHLVVSARSGG